MSRDTNTNEHDCKHDDGSWSRFAAVAVAVVVLASTVAVAPAVAQSDNGSGTFIVKQGGTCTQVTPLGNGTESVEDFYDYRSPVTDQEGLYSSYGTTDIQMSQVSQLFVYRGSGGLSLVFLHDKFGDEHGGFVVTANISGLPADGDWPVEDDTYNHRDDTFEHDNGTSHIEWLSNGNRTDGAAFRGLGSPNYTTITVDMKFNEKSGNYPFEKWDSPPEANRLNRWVVRSGTGKITQLNMNQPVEISPGTCNGGVSTFTATPGGANTTAAGATTGTSGMTTATTQPATVTTATAPASTTTSPTATTATQTPTATTTATPTTQSPTQTTAGASSANQTTNATGASGGTTHGANGSNNGSGGGNGAGGSGGSGSGAFGPGFGIGIAVVALLALAGVALARRE